MEEFSLGSNGDLFIQWNVNMAYKKMNFNQLVAKIHQEFKHTGSLYRAFTEKDGKLIGNEKISIINNMRDIIQLSIVLKALLQDKYIRQELPLEKLKYKFLDEYTFQVVYSFTKQELKKLQTFKDWYDNDLSNSMNQLFKDLRVALEDKVITVQEATELGRILDKILLGSSVLYHKLKFEGIHN